MAKVKLRPRKKERELATLEPNDFSTVAVLKRDLIRFQERYEKSAKPFEWTFTRRDLHDLLAKLNSKSDDLAA